ncbi:MAG: signal recognition particle-docking protein FtsY [Dokdonella sp.]|uniref:signal recognition particle-docking protein FtsY n=1 Tax=Dokdonella sp. TaxID=2291710 RepID=UPI0025B97A6B|nr:signal recognition particle-docking protein FtsY [Dokdonella sp.]MBX3700051.1 signal recognition particle-docking protein FtsY [Dokdonella sp.]
MLKFWKKKPAPDATTPTAPATPADDGAATALPLEQAPFETEALLPSTPAAIAMVEDVVAEAPGSAEAPRRSWRERLAGSGFARGLAGLFVRHPKLDDAFLDELETCLITADVGIATATEIVDDLRQRAGKREFADVAALLAALRHDLLQRLAPVARPLEVATPQPFVILVVGVNGVGKTTTIGKLAHRLRGEGRSVLLAAGDTFRAAAVEQLQSWGRRNDVAVVAQGSGADSASVIFDALQTARSRQLDVLIADTAGRLHTQAGLMDELAKIRRVLAKLDPSAPHEVLLVLDGTTGQNALSQARQFKAAIGVTGLVVTKLDGTAKGGIVFALAREFGLPLRYVGLGEQAQDLRVFDAAAFVDGLLPDDLGGKG